MTRVAFLQNEDSDPSHLSAHDFPYCPRSQHSSSSETPQFGSFVEQAD